VIPKTRQPGDQDPTVVRFRRRQAELGESAKPRGTVQKNEPNIVLLLSLAKYESENPEVDYHHRMIENGLAFVVTVALMAMGVWLASSLHE
jgi:hypothetical protein